MQNRAKASGNFLTKRDAGIVKGMLNRGDRQHDVASWFGVNGGRIAEISTGRKFSYVPVAPEAELPPPGPYASGQSSHAAIAALTQAQDALKMAEVFIKSRN